MNFDKKWQDYWKKENPYKVDLNSTKPKYYVLSMFPYPSGSGLHVGHPVGYTAADIIARYKKQKGFEVLNPMGFDSFGLPAEQYAIQTGNSPKEFTLKNIENFKKQLNSLGFSYDWDREVITSEPWYFKHTQWIFAQLYKKGLAEIKEIEVNWSPSLNTVLANEEVIEINGQNVSERDKKIVEKKVMKQWVLKITKYADQLFEGLDNLDWPNSIKSLQKNWIYRIDEQGNKVLSLHDWVFARQRYWGEPFPIIHKKNGELYLIPEIEYPINLPDLNDYKFSTDGKPALSKQKDWYEVKDPLGERDLNTMPQWAGSCWYFIAFILKHENENIIENIDSPISKKLLEKWLPVDLYIGGQEHAVLHLLYARFWTMVLHDIGIIKIKEPFQKLFCQGMILGPDGTKMSKSRGNVINPDEVIKHYGADTIRVYEMFMGPLESDKLWSDEGLKASYTWLNRVKNLFETISINNEAKLETKNEFNIFLEKIEIFIENLKFNKFVSEMMIFVNYIYKTKDLSQEIAENFIKIFSTIAPHYGEEIWQTILKKNSPIYNQQWPNKFKITKMEKEIIIPIQIDNKIKEEVSLLKEFKIYNINSSIDIAFKDVNDEILEFISFLKREKNLDKHLKNNPIVRIIYIPKKILKIMTNKNL